MLEMMVYGGLRALLIWNVYEIGLVAQEFLSKYPNPLPSYNVYNEQKQGIVRNSKLETKLFFEHREKEKISHDHQNDTRGTRKSNSCCQCSKFVW